MKRICMMLLVMLCVAMTLFVHDARSESPVEFVLDPTLPDNVLPLETGVKEIWIEARVIDKALTLTWKLDGPGQFAALENGLGGVYHVPAHIDGASANAVMTVTAKDRAGKKSQTSLTLTLQAAAPTPTPSPTPAPTATPTPEPQPVTIRQTLLKHDRVYMRTGETAAFVLDLSNPSQKAVTLECSALKGKAECAVAEQDAAGAQHTVRYTAPDAAGKDMLQIKLTAAPTGETDQTLIKIEILAQ